MLPLHTLMKRMTGILIIALVTARFQVIMTNVLRAFHILLTFFTSFQTSEITAKCKKRGKYWPYCTMKTCSN